MVDVDGFQTVGNLSDMPETGKTRILVFTEVGFDFLALGGGFHDDEGATGGTKASRSGSGRRCRSYTMRRCIDFKLGGHNAVGSVCCRFIYKIRIQFYTCFIYKT